MFEYTLEYKFSISGKCFPYDEMSILEDTRMSRRITGLRRVALSILCSVQNGGNLSARRYVYSTQATSSNFKNIWNYAIFIQ